MPKGYSLSAHRSQADPEKREAYLKLAGPAIEKAGGKVLAAQKMLKRLKMAEKNKQSLRSLKVLPKLSLLMKVTITKKH